MTHKFEKLLDLNESIKMEWKNLKNILKDTLNKNVGKIERKYVAQVFLEKMETQNHQCSGV